MIIFLDIGSNMIISKQILSSNIKVKFMFEPNQNSYSKTKFGK